MSWRMARSLDVLLAEVNASAPRRSKVSDGGIGDPNHSSRVSDHNPNPAGVVRARDFTNDPAGGFDADAFAEHVASLLGKHPALSAGAYVIWDWLIISTSRLSEGWRPYSGSNGHTKHAHVSVGTSGYDNTKSWGWPPTEEEWFEMATKEDLRAVVREEIKKHFDREKARDQREKARDKRRHQKVMALLKGTSADVAAIEAALTEEEVA